MVHRVCIQSTVPAPASANAMTDALQYPVESGVAADWRHLAFSAELPLTFDIICPLLSVALSFRSVVSWEVRPHPWLPTREPFVSPFFSPHADLVGCSAL